MFHTYLLMPLILCAVSAYGTSGFAKLVSESKEQETILRTAPQAQSYRPAAVDLIFLTTADLYKSRASQQESKESEEQAVQFYKKAANSRMRGIRSEAETQLMEAYLHGLGVNIDYAKAFKHAQSIAEQKEHTQAQWLGKLRLGQMTFLGQGIKKYDRKAGTELLLQVVGQQENIRAQTLARGYLAAFNACGLLSVPVEADLHAQILKEKHADAEAKTLARLVDTFKASLAAESAEKYMNILRSLHSMTEKASSLAIQLLGKILLIKADEDGCDRVVEITMKEMAQRGESERSLACGVSDELKKEYIAELSQQHDCQLLHTVGIAMQLTNISKK